MLPIKTKLQMLTPYYLPEQVFFRLIPLFCNYEKAIVITLGSHPPFIISLRNLFSNLSSSSFLSTTTCTLYADSKYSVFTCKRGAHHWWQVWSSCRRRWWIVVMLMQAWEGGTVSWGGAAVECRNSGLLILELRLLVSELKWSTVVDCSQHQGNSLCRFRSCSYRNSKLLMSELKWSTVVGGGGSGFLGNLVTF